MIVAEQKSLPELKRMLKGKKKVLAVGCGTCVSVCFSGGKKETAGLASALRAAAAVDGEKLEIEEHTVQRQCVKEFVEPLSDEVDKYDAVLSLGCGVGVQTLAEYYPETRVLPGLDTQFMGQPTETGVWEERCVGCGNCVLEYTGGLCPITRCPKQLFNGPCGGAENGMCEVDTSIPCVWAKIWDNSDNLDLVDSLMDVRPPQDWSTSRSGGLRKTVVRDDLVQPFAIGLEPPTEQQDEMAGKKSPQLNELPVHKDSTVTSGTVWTRICGIAEVTEGTMKKINLKNFDVMVANLGDCIRVFPPTCPHMAEPLAESGSLEGEKLTCTKHIWQWDLRSLEMGGMAERSIEIYPCKVEKGEILADIETEILYEYDIEEELDDDDFFAA